MIVLLFFLERISAEHLVESLRDINIVRRFSRNMASNCWREWRKTPTFSEKRRRKFEKSPTFFGKSPTKFQKSPTFWSRVKTESKRQSLTICKNCPLTRARARALQQFLTFCFHNLHRNLCNLLISSDIQVVFGRFLTVWARSSPFLPILRVK